MTSSPTYIVQCNIFACSFAEHLMTHWIDYKDALYMYINISHLETNDIKSAATVNIIENTKNPLSFTDVELKFEVVVAESQVSTNPIR